MSAEDWRVHVGPQPGFFDAGVVMIHVYRVLDDGQHQVMRFSDADAYSSYDPDDRSTFTVTLETVEAHCSGYVPFPTAALPALRDALNTHLDSGSGRTVKT